MTILFFTLAFLLCTPSFGRTLDPILQSTLTNRSNSTTNLLSPGNIPNPFIWDPDAGHKLFFDRKPLDHRHQSNPGVSQNNWRSAVVEASLKAFAMQQEAHVGIDAIVADNHFLYENTLAFLATAHYRSPRRIRIEMKGRGQFPMHFKDVHLILQGLLEYSKIWIRPHHNAPVLMCKVTMYSTDAGPQLESAEGSVTLIVPPVPSTAAVAES